MTAVIHFQCSDDCAILAHITEWLQADKPRPRYGSTSKSSLSINIRKTKIYQSALSNNDRRTPSPDIKIP